MQWRIHKALVKDRLEEVLDVINSFGDTVQVVEGAAYSTDNYLKIPPRLNPCIVLSTLQDVRKMQIQYPREYNLRTWYDDKAFNVSGWMPEIPHMLPAPLEGPEHANTQHVLVLNRDGIFAQFGNLECIQWRFVRHWMSQDGGVFVRPDSGFKLFTGFVIKPEDINDDWHGIKKKIKEVYPQINNNTMLYFSGHKYILPVEYRFWVCNNKIIGHSPYSWNTELELPVNSPAPEEAVHLVEKLIKSNWTENTIGDMPYVVDLVESNTWGNNGWRILEINAVSTSGLYHVDVKSLLSGLREYAIEEDKRAYGR